jgi:hypothetical protein
MKKFLFADGILILIVFTIIGGASFAAPVNSPADLPPTPPCGTFAGTIIDPMDTLANPPDVPSTTGWYRSSGGGAVGSLSLVAGHAGGQALKLTYDLGSQKDAYVQFVRMFDPPLDLSAGDHLRFLHQGTQPNSIEVGLISTENLVPPDYPNYFASAWDQAAHIPWWTYATWDFKDFRRVDMLGKRYSFPNFSQVKGVFISVVYKTNNDMGGSGSFTVDDLQILKLANRTVPAVADTITVNATAITKAADWIAAHQQPSGLLASWPEQALLLPPEKREYAWLYDQALGLLVLSDRHQAGDVTKARNLVDKLRILQNDDDSWFSGYDYVTSAAVNANKDVGPIAWLVYALVYYADRETDVGRANAAYKDAGEAAAWMAKQQLTNGSLGGITEWNLDSWWAFQVTGLQTPANRVRDYLLNQVWDSQMRRFKSSPSDYQIFLDNQTWGAPFLQALNRTDDALAALSYAQANLVTTSSNGAVCGLDGAGPFAPWNEGTGQYVAQRGPNSQHFWNQLVAQQAPDGGMPNSPDPLIPAFQNPNNCPFPAGINFCAHIVWLSRWYGVAPTAWLYFAGTGGPFPATPRQAVGSAPIRNYYTTATPTLTWNRVSFAIGYEIQVSKSSSFAPLAYTTQANSSALQVTTTPLPDGMYYWRARVKRLDGAWGPWSTVESFIVDLP